MSVNYAKHVSTKITPQSEAIPGTPQVPNSAGGFSFPVDKWTRLDRFLVLGSEGGSYYANERKLTKENAQSLLSCLAEDGMRTVNRIVEISEAGRAPKNDAAIFALAVAAAYKPDAKIRQAALDALPKVCRIGTHLFQFNEMVEQLRGRGRSLNRAVANWYLQKDARDLAFQVTKYQQRNGWSHRDLLRLSKPRATPGTSHQEIFYWVTKGWNGVGEQVHPNPALVPIWAMEKAKTSTTADEVAKLILDHNMPRECIPTQWLNEACVWEALLEKMPMTAMIRNLATMTRIGILTPMSAGMGKVMKELGDAERLKKSRIHPVGVLSALLTYKQGHGERGGNTWTPVTQIVDALDGAFYKSFDNVEPTGKRWFLGIDVSGSMYGSHIAGLPGLTAGYGAAAMAMVTAKVEPSWYMACFDTEMHPFAPSPKQRLDDVARMMQNLPWGGTDCAQPMLHAMKHNIPVDTFVVYTDSETWAGKVHPTQALAQYRQKTGIPAKLIVVGMVGNEFSIADPEDGGMMDVVGFSTDTPAVMADFAR